MSGIADYEQLVTNEDVLVWRLQTLERVQGYLFEFVYEQANAPQLLMMEDALLALHSLENDARLELLHLRLKKARTAATLR
jgi:hypothetical protein